MPSAQRPQGWRQAAKRLPQSTSYDSFRSDKIGTETLDSCFDAFSSREPVSTSLENALGPEYQAAAGRCVDHAVWHLRPCLEQEVEAAAMHRNHHIRFKLLYLGRHLSQVIGGP